MTNVNGVCGVGRKWALIGFCMQCIQHFDLMQAHYYRGGGGGLRGGTISWENFVLKEGGEIFPWQSSGVLAV